MAELLAAVEGVLVEQMVELEVVLPYVAGDLLNLWHTQGVIESQSFREDGTHVRGRLPNWLVDQVQAEAKGRTRRLG